jgi:hypothetical protein
MAGQKQKGTTDSDTKTVGVDFFESIVADTELTVVKVFGGQDDDLEISSPNGVAKSKQMPPNLFEKDIRAGNVIAPLYDPLIWAFLLEQSTRLTTLVRSMANNTVGLGWELVPAKEEQTWLEQNRDEIDKEKELVTNIFETPNLEMPFNETLKCVKIDEETTGGGWLEILPTVGSVDEVGGFSHIPSYTMRVAKYGDKYVQMRPSDTSKKVYFKPFGERRDLNCDTGEWGTDEAPVPDDKKAREVFYWKLYSPRSSFYGVPRAVATAPAISGTRLAHRRNVNFFENDATPRLAVIVNGGELGQDSLDMIKDFAEVRGKGVANAGRVMVLQARAADNIAQNADQLRIQLVPLTVGVQDDASFAKYIQMNNEEIREAFGIGQIFIGTSDDVNRAVALAMKQLTVEQVFEPEAVRYEYRFNLLMKDRFGVKHIRLKFKRPRTTDLQAESQAFAMLASAGGVTPNDIRDFLGKPRFEGAWANTPIAILRAGLMEERGQADATLFSHYGDAMPSIRLVNEQAELAAVQTEMAKQGGEAQKANMPIQQEAAKAQLEVTKAQAAKLLTEAKQGPAPNPAAIQKAAKEFFGVGENGEDYLEMMEEVQSLADRLGTLGLKVEVAPLTEV